jgi:hypothetical protein
VDQTLPLLLLDLDGVLNPFAAATCLDGYEERMLFEGEDPVRFCFQHGEWIRELARVGDVLWATGWGATANEVYLPLLGLEPLPFVQFPPIPFEAELKVPAIDAVVGDRPAVWIDDNHTAAGLHWAATRTAPTLLVPIDPAAGWRREHVDQTLKWMKHLRLHRCA